MECINVKREPSDVEEQPWDVHVDDAAGIQPEYEVDIVESDVKAEVEERITEYARIKQEPPCEYGEDSSVVGGKTGCGMKCLYQCSTKFTTQEKEDLKNAFRSLNRAQKYKYYKEYTSRVIVNRRRTKVDNSRRKNTFEYYLKKKDLKQRVCQKFFCCTLDIYGKRVHNFYKKLEQPWNVHVDDAAGTQPEYEVDIVECDVKAEVEERIIEYARIKQEPPCEYGEDSSVVGVAASCESAGVGGDHVCHACSYKVNQKKLLRIHQLFSCCELEHRSACVPIPGTSKSHHLRVEEVKRRLSCDEENIYNIKQELGEPSKEDVVITYKGNYSALPGSSAINPDCNSNASQEDHTSRKRRRQPYCNRNGKLFRSKLVKTGCGMKCLYQCSTKFTTQEKEDLKNAFHSLNRAQKYKYYKEYTSRAIVNRRRTKVDNSRRKNSFGYYLKKKDLKQRVCQKFFCCTLDISEKRVHNFYKKLEQPWNVHVDDAAGIQPEYEVDIVECDVKAEVEERITEYARIKQEPPCEYEEDSSVVGVAASCESAGDGVDHVCPACSYKVNQKKLLRIHQLFSCCELEHTSECVTIPDTSKTHHLRYTTSESGPAMQDITIHNKKRRRQPEKWQKNVLKKKREAGEEYCNRNGKLFSAKLVKTGCGMKCLYQCSTKFKTQEKEDLKNAFYSLNDSQKYLYYKEYTSRVSIYRRKIKASNSRRKNTFEYYFKKEDLKQRVCQKFFCCTLDISCTRVHHFYKVLDKQPLTTTVPTPCKGKFIKKKIADHKIEEVVQHINSFPTEISPYCRANSNRQYLDKTLSISKMYALYVKVNKEPVKENIYRKVFKENFNLSFFRPKKGVCDTCCEFMALKNPNVDKKKKRKEIGNTKRKKVPSKS